MALLSHVPPTRCTAGVRALVRPLSSWYAGAASGAAALGVLGQSSDGGVGGEDVAPLAVHEDLAALPKPEPLTLTRQLRDDERCLEALVPAPQGPLLAAPDSHGRVLLLDGASGAALRMWKARTCANDRLTIKRAAVLCALLCCCLCAESVLHRPLAPLL